VVIYCWYQRLTIDWPGETGAGAMHHGANTDGCGGEHVPSGTTTVAALIPELLTRAQTGGCGARFTTVGGVRR